MALTIALTRREIGNILATSCFYSDSHYEFLHRVVIACARLNEKKRLQQQTKGVKECGRVSFWYEVGISIQNEWHWQRHRRFYSHVQVKSEKTMHFVFYYTRIRKRCLANIPRKCRAFESFSLWVSFKHEIHFTRKSQTCIQTSTNVF